MWRLKYWLSRLGAWLWLYFGGEKIYIAFRHTECGSEVVELADFRRFGPEFQCFQCNTLVPPKNISFRILSAEEVEKIKIIAEAMEEQDYQDPDIYFRSTVLPHVVT